MSEIEPIIFKEGKMKILDQTKLPLAEEYIIPLLYYRCKPNTEMLFWENMNIVLKFLQFLLILKREASIFS